MKERPINLKAHEVLAILDGRKTQMRRVVFNKRTTDFQSIEERDDGSLWPWRETDDAQDHWYPCPYGQPGDRLWVRENFSGPWCMETQDGSAAVPPSKWGLGSRIWYWADGEPSYGDWTRPRPSIHMPRWASRITLEVTGVRVERLQDISVADAIAEGVNIHPDHHGKPRESIYSAVEAYRDLWEQINGPGSWDANPLVWVVEFERIKP